MSLDDRLLQETIQQIYENRYKLDELAKDKRDITRDLYADSKQVVEHIIRCMLWPDSRDIQHWKTEIIGSMFEISKYKSSNNYPSFKQITQWFLIGKLEDVANSLEVTVRIVCRKERRKPPKNINLENTYNCIADYLTWLCKSLSETGVVDDNDMEDKLDELFLKYK